MNTKDKIFLTFLVVGAIATSALAVFYGTKHKPVLNVPVVTIEQMRSETVLIDNDEGQGSGFILNGTEVLTADHVVKDMKDTKITVTFFNGEKVPAVVEWESKNADVAILSVKSPIYYKSASIACRAPITDEDIAVVGSPMALRWIVSRGHILTDRPLEIHMKGQIPDSVKQDAADLVPFDAVSAPGGSGGPVFDSKGEVIGIVDAIMVETFGHTKETFRFQASTINFMVKSQFFCGNELKKV